MNNYFAKRALISLSSIALAAALVILTFVSIFIGFFNSEGKIKSEIGKNYTLIAEAVDEAVKPAAKRFSLPEEALTGAIDSSNADIIAGVAAHSLINGYTIDLSDSTELFSAYMSKLKSYCEESGKQISEKDRIEISSYAVDLVSNALYTSESVNAPVFAYAKNRIVMYAIIASVIIIAVSVIIIDLFTRGRHRKFSFIGMGIITAGYVNIGLPLWIRYKGYFKGISFLSFSAYNQAVNKCFNDILKLSLAIGAVMFVAGLVILLVNYNYFRKKNAQIKAERERANEIMGDYMETENNRPIRLPGEEFEKEIMKIDFD